MTLGDRVHYRGRAGRIDQMKGIHVRVVFDDPPDWPQIIDGGCWFYTHELTPLSRIQSGEPS